jgi:hypothetical protein
VTEAGTDCLPQALVDCLLDSALEPVLEAAAERGRRAAKRRKGDDEAGAVAKALLAVTVCDPACGSGNLLLAAAGRIARRVAQAREGNHSPDALARAMREAVDSCVYGVDADGAAVERAREGLRLAADVPGQPPLFLDSRVRQGNALIGASPGLIDGGIPDAAFRPADGDDPKRARALRRANTRPVPGQATLFSERGGYSHANEGLAKSLATIELPATGLGQAAGGQAAAYRNWREAPAFRAKRLVADAWCAAFTWAMTPEAPPAVVNRVLLDLREQGADGILPETLAEIGRLREAHGFFHWHLEFPGVFRVVTGEIRGGFDCVLSAPPHGKIDRHGRSADFAFAAASGLYPQCAGALAEPGVSALRADLLLTERTTALLTPGGRAGCAVAQGTAAAPAARQLLADLMRRGALASLYDFTGPDAPSCLLTIAGGAPSRDNSNWRAARAGAVQAGADADTPRAGDPESGAAQSARFAFRLSDPAELADAGRSFSLTADEAALINPNTGALPPFRSARDAALVTAVYRRVPALCNDGQRDETQRHETRPGGNPWKLRLATAFPRAAADTGLLRTEQELQDEGWEPQGSAFTRDGQRMLPFYEPPMLDTYDHSAAKPGHWVAEHGPVAVSRNGETANRPGVADRLAELGWRWEWLCAWRTPADERTAVAAFLPRAATADSVPLMLPRVVPPFAAALIAAQSSLVFRYVARQKLDGPAVRPAHWKQLPVPSPDTLEPHLPFLVPRVLELAYTSPDLAPLARDLDDPGDPFDWDPDRRASLRAELDAFFFHAYGIDDRADVEYITDTIQDGADDLDRDESQGDGIRRTRQLVLTAYDRLAEAAAAGTEYETRIFPPPGHGPRNQPA